MSEPPGKPLIFSNSFFKPFNFSLFSFNLLSSLIITLNSLSGLDFLSPFQLILLRFYLVHLFGTYSSLLHHSWFAVFVSVCLVGWLCFLAVEKQPLLGDVLCVSAAYMLVPRLACSRGASSVGCVGPPVPADSCRRLTTVGRLVGCQAPPGVLAAVGWAWVMRLLAVWPWDPLTWCWPTRGWS